MCEIMKKLIKSKEVQERCNCWVESQKDASLLEDPLYISKSNDSDEFDTDSEFDSVSQCGTKRRRMALPMKAEKLDMLCEWKDCEFRHWSPKRFLEHVGGHIPELELKVLGDDNSIYVCGWKSCPYETTLSNEITWHVYYHAYHTKIKSIGINIRQRTRLPKCLLETGWTIIELPPTLICQWDDCSKTFNKYQALLDHVTIHVEKNPRGNKVEGGVKCKWAGCTGKFASVYKLRDHVRSHTKEKIVACPDCGFMFSTNSRFREHCERQIPLDKQGFQCSHCNKFYATEKILKDHMRQHIFTHKCSMCDMSCESVAALAKHIRYRHLNERAFACQLCKHAAKTQQDLDYHMSVHTKGPNFFCTVDGCIYQCKNAYILDRHVEKVHCQEVRWYCCHECPVKYQKSYRLSRHLMDAHDLQLPSGHKRFQYNKDVDGCYRVQTIRYESIDDDESKPVSIENIILPEKNYTLKITQDSAVRVEVMEAQDDPKVEPEMEMEEQGQEEKEIKDIKNVKSELGKSMPVISNILISIDEMDEEGNIIRSKIVETQETNVLPPSEEPPIILT